MHQGLSVSSKTDLDGYTLAGSTGTVLSWTVPDDGEIHVVEVMLYEVVTSALTGGAVSPPAGGPSDTAQTITVLPAGVAVGVHGSAVPTFTQGLLVYPGSRSSWSS